MTQQTQNINSAEAEKPLTLGHAWCRELPILGEALRIGDGQNTDPCIPFLGLPGGKSHRAVTGGIVHFSEHFFLFVLASCMWLNLCQLTARRVY